MIWLSEDSDGVVAVECRLVFKSLVADRLEGVVGFFGRKIGVL